MFKKINILMIFLFQRVFMFILKLYQKPHRIAQQLLDILILTVKNKNFLLVFRIEFWKSKYLDTGHGPREADIWHRHVGDLGNLTTDANGVININLSDYIIQFYNSTQSIADRTIVIHQMFDDGGSTGFAESNITGYDIVFSIFLLIFHLITIEMLVLELPVVLSN